MFRRMAQLFLNTPRYLKLVLVYTFFRLRTDGGIEKAGEIVERSTPLLFKFLIAVFLLVSFCFFAFIL